MTRLPLDNRTGRASALPRPPSRPGGNMVPTIALFLALAAVPLVHGCGPPHAPQHTHNQICGAESRLVFPSGYLNPSARMLDTCARAC